MTPIGQDDSVRESWNRGMVVLFKGNPQDKDVNKYQIEMSFRVARALLYKILKDTEEMNIRFSVINKSLRQIDPLASDYLVGWRIELDIEVMPQDGCYDQDDWDNTIEETNPMTFLLSKTETGYTAVKTDVLDGSWTYLWKYQLANASQQTSSSSTLTVTSAATDIYVILEATHSGGLVRIASAFLESTSVKIKSVPYLYSKYRK